MVTEPKRRSGTSLLEIPANTRFPRAPKGAPGAAISGALARRSLCSSRFCVDRRRHEGRRRASSAPMVGPSTAKPGWPRPAQAHCRRGRPPRGQYCARSKAEGFVVPKAPVDWPNPRTPSIGWVLRTSRSCHRGRARRASSGRQQAYHESALAYTPPDVIAERRRQVAELYPGLSAARIGEKLGWSDATILKDLEIP
jgi:hypothetical protein